MTKEFSSRPDARLVRLHAERGDPQARLGAALAALEGADWGLLFSGEMALARQLAALIGTGTLRVDGRVDVNRHALAEAGLAATDLHGDLGGARAVWLFEPDQATFDRARRAGVRVIVDGTLAPGGDWTAHGADFVVYRNAVTLTGHHGQPLAALFGLGTPPQPVAAPPSDLAVAMVLRDVATLPLRLARFARTTAQVGERLGAVVRPAGPTALLLAPDAAADTLSSLGGVLAAARHVPDGLLLTPGLEDAEQVLALLRGEGLRGEGQRTEATRGTAAEERPRREARDSVREQGREQGERPRRERDMRDFRRDRPRFEDRRDDRPRRDRFQPERQGERPQPDRAQPDRPQEGAPQPQVQSGELERFTFEAPATSGSESAEQTQWQPSAPLPSASEGVSLKPTESGAADQEEPAWEPEIVFSHIEQPAVPLTHTVSSGPDAAPLPVIPPLADAEVSADDIAPDPIDPADPDPTDESEGSEGEAAVEQAEAAEVVPAPAVILAPDLPTTPSEAEVEGPAADLTEEQSAIYARLREWRNAEAKRQEISRFIVASNATLADIARRVPYTLEDLAAVRGMGPARLGKYGEKILEVVRG